MLKSSESMINMEQLGEVAKKREQTRRKTGEGCGEENSRAVSVQSYTRTINSFPFLFLPFSLKTSNSLKKSIKNRFDKMEIHSFSEKKF